MYETARHVVGMTSTEGTYIGRERIMEGDCSGPRSAQAVLLHPQVEVAVLETARGGILREGLAFDECTVGVVTNVSRDHIGLAGVQTLDDLVKVKQVVVENVARDGVGVLNAEDPRVAEMAAVCSGEVIYFSTHPDSPVGRAHREAGGRCVFVDDGRIVLATGSLATELIELERVPFTADGRIRFQVQNALAAVGAAWGAGLNPAMIARGLSTFSSDPVMVPGRFNVVQLGGRQVVFDYGHNPAALAAVGQAVGVLGRRHTVMLLSLPGDRRDEDLIEALEATRSYVDEYVLFDADRRGRAPGEVSRLLQEHLAGSVPSAIATDKDAATRDAWARARPGGRLIVIVDLGDDALAMLQTLTGSLAEDARCETPIAAGAT
jgi:cyanophycin synthetase